MLQEAAMTGIATLIGSVVSGAAGMVFGRSGRTREHTALDELRASLPVVHPLRR
jgi:hypothetical protein